MSENLEQLEEQVEHAYADLADALSVEVPPAAKSRARAAVRQEINETWLAAQAAPQVRPMVKARIKDRVREELARQRGRRRRYVLSGLAVAAGLVLAVGLSLHFRALQSTSPVAPVGADAVDLFVEASEQVWGTDPVLAGLSLDVDSLEESLTARRSTTDGMEDMLEDIDQGLEELFTEPESLEGMSRTPAIRTGALG